MEWGIVRAPRLGWRKEPRRGPGLTVSDTYPLTPVQHGMLFHGVTGEPGEDIEQIVISLEPEVDLDLLLDAWQRVTDRHPALRTRFRWEDVEPPVQEVLSDFEMPVAEYDWSALEEAQRASRFLELLQDDRNRGFSLALTPPTRLALVRMGTASTELVWTFHHALLDGRSILTVLTEVFTLYDGEHDGNVVELPPCPRPVRDFVEFLGKQDPAESGPFWADLLSGIEAPTPLGDVRSTAAAPEGGQGHDAARVELGPDETDQLAALARSQAVTLNTIIQAAWAILLGRITGSATVVFGATRACRRGLAGADSMVGLLINTVPVRADVGEDRRLVDVLADLRKQWVELRNHEHTPLSVVRDFTKMPRSQPLFESLVVYETYRLSSALTALGPQWARRRVQQLEQSNTPLTFAAYRDAGIVLEIEYDRRRFDADGMRRCARYLGHLLDEMARDPSRRVGELPLIDAEERAEILTRWNRTERPDLPVECVHESFERAAARHPTSPAIASASGAVVSYESLARRVRELAHRLVGLGVGPGERVALCLPRSEDAVVAMLATLEAGGAFVALDVDAPPSRIAFQLADSAPRVVVTRGALATRVIGSSAHVLTLDAETLRDVSVEPLGTRAGLDDDAYVIYTSGSTGQPKGVVVQHRALANHAAGVREIYGLGPNDRVLQFASLGFDVALEEIFPTLAAGACLALRPDDVLSTEAFGRWVDEQAITVLNLPTAYWHEWVEAMAAQGVPRLRALRLLVVGGERVSPRVFSVWRSLFGKRVRWLNGYGPTEATITATLYCAPDEAVHDPAVEVPIGRPLPNVVAHVLDGRMEPVPLGMPGELFLGGVGLARGYLGRPDLTAERFLPDPFSKAAGARLYRTGDRVRRLDDGNLVFLGRVDEQIKFRGFRMEPAEIEAALLRHPAVHQAAVQLHADGESRARLVGYVACRAPVPSAADLRAHLGEILPAYMVPTDFVFLDTMPKSSHDKIDRRALPAPPTVGRSSRAPSSPVEEVLVRIWAEALGLDDVGVDEDFFDLGGHSLLMLKIIDRAARAGVRITPQALIQNPTIARLAQAVDASTPRESDGTLVVLRGTGTNPPLYLVHSTPGDLLGYLDLVHALGPNQPCFGFQSLGLQRREASHTSVEAMAHHYVTRLRERQPRGPYYLGGWCYGGIVAVEMARELLEHGHDVALLALFEAWAPRPSPRFFKYYVDRAKALLSMRPVEIGQLVVQKIESLSRSAEDTIRESLVYEVSSGMLANRAHVYTANMRALETYRSRPLPATIHVFRGVEQEPFTVPDPLMGWESLAAHVELHELPGGHETILKGPNVVPLAQELLRCIEKGGSE